MITIEQDFADELAASNFPYKDILLNKAFESELFKEFSSLEAKPKYSLFVSDKLDIEALHKEFSNKSVEAVSSNGNTTPMANFYPTGEIETLADEVYQEYIKQVATNTIDKKYYGRYLNETPTIELLTKIKGIMYSFDEYAIDHDNTDTYDNYSRAVSIDLIDLLKGKFFKRGLLESFRSQEESTPVTVSLIFGNTNGANVLKSRYELLKRYFNSYIIKEIKLSEDQDTVASGVSKLNGKENFIIPLHKIIKIYELCEEQNIFKDNFSFTNLLNCFDEGASVGNKPSFPHNSQIKFVYILSQIEGVNDKIAKERFGIGSYRTQKSRALKENLPGFVFRNQVESIINSTK